MLKYGFVSTIIDEDRQKLRDGMRVLSSIAHKYNIPVTWVITADSAQYFAKDLTEWHREFGDEPLMMLDIKPLWLKNWYAVTDKPDDDTDVENDINRLHLSAPVEVMAEHLVKMREELPRYIRTEWKKIERAMEWAVPSVAGAVWKNRVLIQALEQVGFRGIWGYRWEERESITEVDRGCPFGFFYPSAEQHNFCAPAAGNITAIPYNTSSHLNKEDQTLRASLINDYLLQDFNIYVENVRWNQWLSYVEHVNILDVAQLGQESLEKLDAYFEYVARSDTTRLLPLSEMVDDYWESCQQTESTFVITNTLEEHNTTESIVTDTTDSSEENKVKDEAIDNKVFFYYDAECQFSFVKGKMEPIEMKNYITPPVSDNIGMDALVQDSSIHGVEYHLPKVLNFRLNRKRSRLHITFTIESSKAMPYGVAVWGNHVGLQLAQTNAKDVTWVDKYLLFIRLALVSGGNDFEVVLTI